MKTLFLVGLGGGLGSILRYLTTLFIIKYGHGGFPIATFTVNMIGCLLVGVILGILEQKHLMHSSLLLFFITGFCGGYTTFSAFAVENIMLLQHHNLLLAFFYIGASIFLGLLAVWLGLTVVKQIYLNL